MDGPRAPRRDELDALLDLLCDVWEHFPRRYSQRELHSAIRRRVHRREARVIVEDGRVVSAIQMLYNYVSMHGCRVKVASIGGVCTRKDRRRRGLAGAVLAHCLKEMAARGAHLLYVSGDRSLYRRNHCVKVGEFLEAELSRETLGPVTSSPAVRRIAADQWPAVAPLHQAEAVRFVRRADFLSEACFWWDQSHPEIWAVEHKERPVSYLIVAPPREGSRAGGGRVVTEYGGSRAAMLDALPCICERSRIPRVKLAFPAHDRDLIHLLGGLGTAMKPVTLLDHTVRILDLPALMRRLRPYLASLLRRTDLRRLSFGQQEDTCVFRYGEESAELDLAQSAGVVFGGPNAAPMPGALGRVLSQVFPLPMPDPGLNYI